jgi:hypothetical protein
MTDLSPAAQAIMVAATNGNMNVVNDPVYKQCIAAALQAAADQVVPEEAVRLEYEELSLQRLCQRERTRKKLLASAAELEGGNG